MWDLRMNAGEDHGGDAKSQRQIMSFDPHVAAGHCLSDRCSVWGTVAQLSPRCQFFVNTVEIIFSLRVQQKECCPPLYRLNTDFSFEFLR